MSGLLNRIFIILFSVMVLFAVPAGAQVPDTHYWRLHEIQAQFDTWQAEYPEIFYQMIIGTSGRRVDIPMVRISDNAAISEPQPRLLFHGALHANEPNGTTAIMKSIEALLVGYNHDPAVTARVNNLEQFFVPILNVDGHNHVFSGGQSWEDWRKTTRDNNNNGQLDFPYDGVDLNRNWDWNWDAYDGNSPAFQEYKGPIPFCEPEIVGVKNFILKQRPVVVVDYHSPVSISWKNCIFWPWLDTYGGGMSPDATVAEDIAELWAAATIDENENPYREVYAYSTLPKEQCWVYGKTGTLAFIMEISDHCWWSGADVDTIAVRVARGSDALVDRVLYGPGIKGQVIDFETGEALEATVKIHEMHSDAVGPRLAEHDFGTYHRLTTTGEFTVTASCDGYLPETKLASVNDGWEKQDFALTRDISGVQQPLDISWLSTQHLFGSDQSVRLEMPAGGPAATVELFDLRGHRVGLLGTGLEAGRSHVMQLPERISGGVYLVRVIAGDQQQTGRVTIVR